MEEKKKKTYPIGGGPSETCHFSHSLSQPWDTLQTHLRVVHAIYQEDKETLQKKKKGNRKNIKKERSC